MEFSGQSSEEEALLHLLAPDINRQLGGGGDLVVWYFTASFMPDDNWVSRIDYTLEGEDKKSMKSLLMEGRGFKIDSMTAMRPRIILEQPSVAALRVGLIMMEVESPDPGERVV
jgi:hypothetical protein